LVEPDVLPTAPPADPAGAERVEVPSTEAAPAATAPAASTAATTADRAAHVRGRCVDGAARPLAGVRITGAGVDARSGDDGAFALAIDLGGALRQTRTLEFASAGLGSRRISALLRAGEPHDLADVVLLAACRLAGRVLDAHGGPLEAEVRVEEALDRASGSRFTGPSEVLAAAKSGADGAFALEAVAPGHLRVWAGREDWLWSSSEPLELP